MEKSEKMDQLAIALNNFQAELDQPSLNAKVKVATRNGGSYGFKYADLSECKRAAKQPLADNGLSVSQLLEEDNCLTTILLHTSGQWISSKTKMVVSGTDAQAMGSAITYAKRYAFCAMLGIVADDDEDGNIACGNRAEKKTTYSHKKTYSPTWRTDQRLLSWIYKRECEAKDNTEFFSVEELIKSTYKVERDEDLEGLVDSYVQYKIDNSLI